MEELINKELVEKKFRIRFKRLRRYYSIRQENVIGSDKYYNWSKSIADLHFNLGTYQYLLRQFNEARNNFTSACENYRIANEGDLWGKRRTGIAGTIPLRWIQCAILSKDTSLREKCSKDLLENIPEKSGPNYLYHEVLALCHYLQSDLDKAKEEANNYRIDNQKEMKMEHARSAAVINSGREKMIEAIIDKDRDLFVKACIDGLKKFSSTFDKKRDVPLEPLILSYLTLARERGIGIEEEDIPEKLRLFVFRFFEDEGQG